MNAVRLVLAVSMLALAGWAIGEGRLDPARIEPRTEIVRRGGIELVDSAGGPVVRVEYDLEGWRQWSQPKKRVLHMSWKLRRDESTTVRVRTNGKKMSEDEYVKLLALDQRIRGTPSKLVRTEHVEIADRRWLRLVHINENTRPHRYEIDYFNATDNGHVVMSTVFAEANEARDRDAIRWFLEGVRVEPKP